VDPARRVDAEAIRPGRQAVGDGVRVAVGRGLCVGRVGTFLCRERVRTHASVQEARSDGVPAPFGQTLWRRPALRICIV